MSRTPLPVQGRIAAMLPIVGLLVGCSADPGPKPSEPAPPASVEEELERRRNLAFVDLTDRSGIDFLHVSGDPAQRHIVESMSGGAAFLDFDGDDYLDLFLVNATRFDDDQPLPLSRLYRNEASGRAGERVFSDVTSSAGVGSSGWGMGVAVADYDNDGDTDLLVTHWGPNQLYRNEGDGTFADVGAAAGVTDSAWATSAAFTDLDGDGWLDLYVTNYVEFDASRFEESERCQVYGDIDGFCGPVGWASNPDLLYRNRGDGTFADVGTATGIADHRLPGLGVVAGDFDGDGDPDLYVANDKEANQLWRNDGDWHLTEVGVIAGVAYSGDGTAQAGMGVDSGDFDNDGDLDLFVTNFSGDVNTLYQNLGDGLFSDATAAGGLDGRARPLLGWSTAFIDADNDGWQDLFVANGHLYPQLEQQSTSLLYAQPSLLYWNLVGTFAYDAPRWGLGIARVSRGAAFGDYDNDGDVDVVVCNLNDNPTLLRNDGGSDRAWLGLDLIGTAANRDAIGTRVIVRSAGLVQTREVKRAYGYQSGHDGRLLFGLGDAEAVEAVEIRWPSGKTAVIAELPLRRYHLIREDQPTPITEYADQAIATAHPPPTGIDAAATRAAPTSQPATASPKELYQVGVELHEGARYAEAAAHFRAAIAQQSGPVAAYHALATSLYEGLGQPREALEVLRAAADLDSATAPVLSLMGAIELGLGHPEAALTAYERATQVAPHDWQVRQQLGLVHTSLGNLEAALAALTSAASIAPYAPTPHAHLARLYARLGRSEEARRERELFERWRPVRDRLYLYHEALERAPQDAELYLVIGQQYLLQSRAGEAEAAFASAVALKPESARARLGLAGALHAQGKLDRAIAEYGFSYIADAGLVSALSDMGLALQQSGRTQEAIATLEKVVELAPGQAAFQRNLAALYAAAGRDAEAATAGARAALQNAGTSAISSSVSGLDDARAFIPTGRAAEELYKRALTAWSQAVGRDHPYVLANLGSLGGLYHTWGRYRDAETLLRRALRIRQQVFGQRHPETAIGLASLAALYTTVGRLDEAEDLLRLTLDIREAGGNGHPQMAATLSALGRVYQLRGRFAAAERLFARALGIRERGLGDRHPDVATSLLDLGSVWREQGLLDEAEPHLRRALRIWMRSLSPDHPDVATALDALGDLAWDRGDLEGAEASYRRSLRIRRTSLPAGHVDTGVSLSTLGRTLRARGRDEEAERLYAEALALWIEALGPEHPRVAALESEYADRRHTFAD